MHSRAAASLATAYANRSVIRPPDNQMPARIGRRRRTGRRQWPPGTVTSSNASQHDHPKPSGNMHSDWLPYSVAGAAAIFIAVGLWLVGLWGDGRSDYRGPLPFLRLLYREHSADVRELLGHLPERCRYKSTWEYVTDRLTEAASSGDTQGVSVSLKLVLSMDGVEYR